MRFSSSSSCTPLQSWHVDGGLERRGCFLYATKYPYSHCVLGMALTGDVLASTYAAFTNCMVGLGDLAAIMLTTLTYVLLEWPSYRADAKMLPHDSITISAGTCRPPGQFSPTFTDDVCMRRHV